MRGYFNAQFLIAVRNFNKLAASVTCSCACRWMAARNRSFEYFRARTRNARNVKEPAASLPLDYCSRNRDETLAAVFRKFSVSCNTVTGIPSIEGIVSGNIRLSCQVQLRLQDFVDDSLMLLLSSTFNLFLNAMRNATSSSCDRCWSAFLHCSRVRFKKLMWSTDNSSLLPSKMCYKKCHSECLDMKWR